MPRDSQIHSAPQGHAPPTADWIWRPEVALPGGSARLAAPAPGLELAGGVTVFHDCPGAGLALLAAPRGFRFEAGAFTGSYLSLVVDLPAAVLTGLGAYHILGLGAGFVLSRAVPVYARVNLRQAPNTQTLVAGATPGSAAEFDLGFSGLGPLPVTAGWAELIFEAGPEMEISLDEIWLYRRPRAEI